MSPTSKVVAASLGLSLIAGGLIYFRVGERAVANAPVSVAAAPQVSAAVPAPIPAAPAVPSALPEPVLSVRLDDSDALARKRAVNLSAKSGWASWLKQDDLIRRAAAAVDSLAAGDSPADSLPFLVPRRRFTVVEGGGAKYADPRSYARYDAATDVFVSIDMERAALVYRQLKPLFQQACAEFGDAKCQFDARIQRAISQLLSVPKVEEQPELLDKGAVYAYADERIEALSAAQKLLLRAGPRNAAKLQGQLRRLSAALKRQS